MSSHTALVGALLAAALATLPHVAAADSLACYKLDGVASQSGSHELTLRILNKTKSQVQIDWIDYDGKRKPRFTLAPGEEKQPSTFATHPWVAASMEDDRCICAHVAQSARRNGKIDEWVIEYEPTDAYGERIVSGWVVKTSSRFKDDPALLKKTINDLEGMLDEMAARLPEAAIAALRGTKKSPGTKIWLERSDCQFPGGVYHPSAAWLESHGMNPDKAKSVQFSADHMDESEDQPAMVLHEFAHAFHDQFLRFDRSDLLAAYKDACKSGRYRSVPHVDGTMQEAYALTDQTEFFAELSESYFWENDFFPFDRRQMGNFDPTSTALIGKLWDTAPGTSEKDNSGRIMNCCDFPRAAGKH